MMYEELVKELKNKYRAYAATDNEKPGRIFLEAADAIEELQQVAAHYEEESKGWWLAACDFKEERERLQEAVPRWIPVTERLPKDRVPVQVCYIGMNTGTVKSDLLACRYYGAWCYWDGEPCSYDECQVEITHWMPLQEPPKEET